MYGCRAVRAFYRTEQATRIKGRDRAVCILVDDFGTSPISKPGRYVVAEGVVFVAGGEASVVDDGIQTPDRVVPVCGRDGAVRWLRRLQAPGRLLLVDERPYIVPCLRDRPGDVVVGPSVRTRRRSPRAPLLLDTPISRVPVQVDRPGFRCIDPRWV